MIVRIVRYSTEAVVDVQEFDVVPGTKLVEFQTMSDVRLRVLDHYEAPPQVEEPHE